MVNSENSVAADPPGYSTAAVANAVAEQFGLEGDYTQLVSERDQNFRLTTTDGKRYVVKVTSLAQDPVVTDFQIEALLWLEDQLVIGVPRIVRSKTGKDRGTVRAESESDGCLRIVTWIDGRLLDDCETSPATAIQLGQHLGALDIAFQNFSHPGESQELLWDTQRAGDLRSLLVHVHDKDVRALLEDVFDDFERKVRPALSSLPTQVIHNDAHGENVLLDHSGNVSGIIDFGDMLRAPRVIDVSTAAAYLRDDGPDPLRLIDPFVSGYHGTNPLLPSELELIFDLTRTRMLITIVLFYWRLEARPEGDPYRQKLLENEGDAFRFLRALSDFGRDAFLERITDNK